MPSKGTKSFSTLWDIAVAEERIESPALQQWSGSCVPAAQYQWKDDRLDPFRKEPVMPSEARRHVFDADDGP
jgi:hypothetical protein